MSEESKIQEIRDAWHAMDPWDRKVFVRLAAALAVSFIVIVIAIAWAITRVIVQ